RFRKNLARSQSARFISIVRDRMTDASWCANSCKRLFDSHLGMDIAPWYGRREDKILAPVRPIPARQKGLADLSQPGRFRLALIPSCDDNISSSCANFHQPCSRLEKWNAPGTGRAPRSAYRRRRRFFAPRARQLAPVGRFECANLQLDSGISAI